jgi:hypothetical protein
MRNELKVRRWLAVAFVAAWGVAAVVLQSPDLAAMFLGSVFVAVAGVECGVVL